MSDDELEKLDLLWSVPEIARFIGRTKRQTYWLLERGALPARKVEHVCS
jgi:hypothetical protein